MLEEFAYPEQDQMGDVIFQEDGAPPHGGWRVRRLLDMRFPSHWIGSGGPFPGLQEALM